MLDQGEANMSRIDERDTIFSRMSLQKGTKRYEDYYARHPEKKAADDKVQIERLARRKEKLNAGSGQRLSDQDHALKSISSSTRPLIRELRDIADRMEPAETKIELPPKELSRHIKEVAVHYGAAAAGIVRLQQEDFYSHQGTERGAGYGTPLDDHWQSAIVFTLEMDKTMINRAPYDEEQLTTMRGYLIGAFVGCQLAMYLKSLGYDAFLNTLQLYNAPMTPLAVKAGLGQRGRNNLLVTENLGCRVRLGAVMTDMPLSGDDPVDFGLMEFCRQCEKCAENCPIDAIPRGDPEEVDGRIFWPLSDTRCMTMWNRAGTDCGICIASCPFTQGVNPEHITRMKNDPATIELILQQDRNEHGRREHIKEKLPIWRLSMSERKR
jgi:ferredoxin